MNNRLRQLLTRWGLRDWSDADEALFDLQAVEYLGKQLFDDYEPSQFDRFDDRLDRWLHNVSTDEDRRVLFRLLGRLFFVGRAEFESLCRATFHGPVMRWLVNELDVDISGENSGNLLYAEAEHTWFCPITDSMRINAFLKVNGLTGKSHRPDWRALAKFGDPKKIEEYITREKMSRLVLLEDFVGSGTQMKSAVKFAAQVSPELRILVCPLVVCPAGSEAGALLEEEYPNVTYEATMAIEPSMLIRADLQPTDDDLHKDVRDLVKRVKSLLGPTEKDADSRRYHGYRDTGAVVALYSNCPNNSLPIMWDKTEGWDPLFPRLKRA